MNARSITLALCLSAVNLPVFAVHHICWVEKVEDVGGAVRVSMRQGYERAARGELNRNSDGSFDLKEGDSVLLSSLPHDSCTGFSVKRGDKLGLELKANNCMPGMGCTQATDFVVGE